MRLWWKHVSTFMSNLYADWQKRDYKIWGHSLLCIIFALLCALLFYIVKSHPIHMLLSSVLKFTAILLFISSVLFLLSCIFKCLPNSSITKITFKFWLWLLWGFLIIPYVIAYILRYFGRYNKLLDPEHFIFFLILIAASLLSIIPIAFAFIFLITSPKIPIDLGFLNIWTSIFFLSFIAMIATSKVAVRFYSYRKKDSDLKKILNDALYVLMFALALAFTFLTSVVDLKEIDSVYNIIATEAGSALLIIIAFDRLRDKWRKTQEKKESSTAPSSYETPKARAYRLLFCLFSLHISSPRARRIPRKK